MEYPGQSFIATLLNYFPRDFYSDKPYPYGQYLTNSILYSKVGAGLYGWTVTSSILDEFVSNFKVFGLIISFIFIYKACNIIDRVKNIKFRLFLMFIFMLLFIVHTSYMLFNIYGFLLYV
ncbi:hypothetical protein [Photobacterium leiognathi]|uniref:hypothetical protein n=1 Tax=Photobacterium leiognathi TaxID=553611 RepID=UPI002733A2B6|nr:hypothetical protein [Photobacterium leiognathi]